MNHPNSREFRTESANVRSMATDGRDQIHVDERGPHWISWITKPGECKPDRAVVLVAASQEEAEARARKWAEQAT